MYSITLDCVMLDRWTNREIASAPRPCSSQHPVRDLKA